MSGSQLVDALYSVGLAPGLHPMLGALGSQQSPAAQAAVKYLHRRSLAASDTTSALAISRLSDCRWR